MNAPIIKAKKKTRKAETLATQKVRGKITNLTAIATSVQVGRTVRSDAILPIEIAELKLPGAPSQVFCQARQSPATNNNDKNHADMFTVQVISRSKTVILVRVHRVDAPGGGWGQDLWIDLIIVP